MTAPQATSPNPQVRFGQPSDSTGVTPGFGRGGAIAGAVLAAVLLGGLVWSAAAGHAATAERPQLIGGSLVLQDNKALPVIDVATGQLTERLAGVFAQVAAKRYLDVQAVPVQEGTMLVNQRTGTFNLLGRDDYVLDAAGAGVGLGPAPPGLAGASGFGSGSSAYIIRYARTSTVSLVNQATIEAGARLAAGGSNAHSGAVIPRGFAALPGPVADQPGSAAVAGDDLWALVQAGSTCQVDQMYPVAHGHNGLLVITRTTLRTTCRQAAIESATATATVAVAWPGHLVTFRTGAPGAGRESAVPATAGDDQFLPVDAQGQGAGGLWFLGRGPATWSVFGVQPNGRVDSPAALARFRRSASPAPPVESNGMLYTLDRSRLGQPELWSIVPGRGAMIPVPGAAHYPLASTSERNDPFVDAQVLGDGPRVVFNNPGNLLAVVVFTDGSHRPSVVDKSQGVILSATGPEDLNLVPNQSKGSHPTGTRGPTRAQPVPQAVSQSVTCANTTQKPYAPQITSVTPSATSALVAWAYQLLDQQDCQPDSWSVKMTAVSSSHQPAQPVQVVNGQSQLQFTGLRPATTYRAVVTAYINAQSTSSLPVTFTTAARGPDAPLTVRTTSDGKGDWIVSWTPCAPAACLVPADTWTIIGTSCGRTYVGQPPNVEVASGQTSVTINADSLGLLGDSLSFSVQGVLASGLTGNPTSDHSCTEAWRPPDRSAISLTAGGAPAGQTITATLEVVLDGASPLEAFGSQSTEFVYRIGSVTLPPTTATRLQVPGLPAGVAYTPTVTIYPAGEPAAAVTVAAATFRPTLQWPAGLGVAATGTTDPSNPNSGTITLRFPGLPPGPMAVTGNPVVCGDQQAQTPINGAVASNGTFTIAPFDLVDLGGDCSLSVSLTALAAPGRPSPYGTPSPALTTSFVIGTVPAYTFSDQVAPGCQQKFCEPEQIEVDYAPTPQLPAPSAGAGWTIVTHLQGGGPECDAQFTQPQPPRFPAIVSLPLSCPAPLVDRVDVQLTYRYLGTTQTVDAGTPSGTPGTTTTSTTTTLPPCPSTTTSSTTSSTSSSTTTTTTPCAPAASAATQLAALQVLPADQAASDAVGSALVATVAASCAGTFGVAWRRRRRRRRPTPKAHTAHKASKADKTRGTA